MAARYLPLMLLLACDSAPKEAAAAPPQPQGVADTAPATSAPAKPVDLALGSLVEQDKERLVWLEKRLDVVLPELMRERGVDAWIVIAREYNEDPTFWSLSAPTTLAARRTTILAFFDRTALGSGEGVERLALGGGSQGGLYEVYRDPEVEGRELYGEAQWGLLKKLLDERKPKRIAINESRHHAFADGLSSGLRARLADAIGPHAAKLEGAEGLAIDYIYQRLPEMRPRYRELMEHAHDIIATAFSNEVITPGKTTTDEVVAFMREEARRRGLGEWFEPTVDVQRQGRPIGSPLDEGVKPVIERGDVLHCDYGVVGMGLATDTQHLGYVLREGESEPPAGLVKALAGGHRLQQILMAEMKPGRTGNEVLQAALGVMKSEGIDGSIYTHPIGDHGHGAGPLIGLWDRQENVPHRGEVKLRTNTWYAIELQATSEVAEWGGQKVRAALEEDAVLNEKGEMEWVLGRQERYHLVK